MSLLHYPDALCALNHLCKRNPYLNKNQIDTFIVKAIELEELQKIHIRHDNSGAGPAWYLEKIEIYNPKTQRTLVFRVIFLFSRVNVIKCSSSTTGTCLIVRIGCRKATVTVTYPASCLPSIPLC
jgi:hypothetical protein